MRNVFILLTLATIASASCASAADWGSIKGRLVVDGAVPEPKPLNVNKDTEYCSQHTPMDETIVPGENGGLPNALVYLYTARGKKVDIHPDLKEVEDWVVLNNKGCRFEPHVALVRTGQLLEIRNEDPGIGHNTNAALLSNPPFNEIVSNDAPIKKTFEKPEGLPATVSCNVHPWMRAYLLIRDNPYMVVTGKDGSFEIANVPAGAQEFIFWHESVGNLKNVKLGEGGKTDRRGRAKLKVAAGETLDLGDIKLTPANLGL